MLLAWIRVVTIGVESAKSPAELPAGLDEFEAGLIFCRLKEESLHAGFVVHVALASIRLENTKFGK